MWYGCFLGMGGDFCVGCGELDDVISLEMLKICSNWCVGLCDW